MPYLCLFCDSTFKGNFRRHINIIHKAKLISVFVLQFKNLRETHSNGPWNENIPYLCLFCNETFREKVIWEHIKLISLCDLYFQILHLKSFFFNNDKRHKKLHYFKVWAHYWRQMSQKVFALFQGSTIWGSTNQGITVFVIIDHWFSSFINILRLIKDSSTE